jgi:hypothetical protein
MSRRYEKKGRTLPTAVDCAFHHVSKEGEVLVQILRAFYRVRLEDVLRTQQSFEWPEHRVVLNVMHPLLIMEEKLFSCLGLPQVDQSDNLPLRQDVKHLRMSILFVASFISDMIGRGNVIEALKMGQHVLKLAKTRQGVQVYRKFFDSFCNCHYLW